MAKRRRKARPLGEMESSDWERGPDEVELTDEDRAKQDRANVWVFGAAAVLLLFAVVKKSS